MPSADEIVSKFEQFYLNFGSEILFIAAMLEALVILNLFAPGQLTIVLGIVFARSNDTSLFPVIGAVALGAVTGYIIDYNCEN